MCKLECLKIMSRRFPVKSMFLGVIGRLIPHRAFTGKILLERLSKSVEVGQLTGNTSVSDDVLINYKIKCGG